MLCSSMFCAMEHGKFVAITAAVGHWLTSTERARGSCSRKPPMQSDTKHPHRRAPFMAAVAAAATAIRRHSNTTAAALLGKLAAAATHAPTHKASRRRRHSHQASNRNDSSSCD